MTIFGFGRKRKTVEEVSSDIKILGSGCAACNTLEENTRKALESLGQESAIEHVTDFAKIAEFGVMTTPALVVDQKVLVSGRVADAQEVAQLIKKARGLS